VKGRRRRRTFIIEGLGQSCYVSSHGLPLAQPGRPTAGPKQWLNAHTCTLGFVCNRIRSTFVCTHTELLYSPFSVVSEDLCVRHNTAASSTYYSSVVLVAAVELAGQ
jgi:hypothetical protein